MVRRLEFSSVLPVSAETLWAHATSAEGINYELAPLLRMTAPDDLGGLGAGADVNVVLGTPLLRSWLLLFGFLPVGTDDIALAEHVPNVRFVEVSRVTGMRSWRHERSLSRAPGGETTLTDRLTFEPRLLAAAYARVLSFLFRHRHARLRARFAATAAAAGEPARV
jgi:hypothetical protein